MTVESVAACNGVAPLASKMLGSTCSLKNTYNNYNNIMYTRALHVYVCIGKMYRKIVMLNSKFYARGTAMYDVMLQCLDNIKV